MIDLFLFRILVIITKASLFSLPPSYHQSSSHSELMRKTQEERHQLLHLALRVEVHILYSLSLSLFTIIIIIIITVVKQEPMDVDEPVRKPVKLVGHVEKTSHTTTAFELFQPTEVRGVSVCYYFNFLLQEAKGQFLFFQLPDCLPLPSLSSPSPPPTPSSTEKMDTNEAPKSSTKVCHCLLHFLFFFLQGAETVSGGLMDVPDGLIGHLRIHKSGRVK